MNAERIIDKALEDFVFVIGQNKLEIILGRPDHYQTIERAVWYGVSSLLLPPFPDHNRAEEAATMIKGLIKLLINEVVHKVIASVQVEGPMTEERYEEVTLIPAPFNQLPWQHREVDQVLYIDNEESLVHIGHFSFREDSWYALRCVNSHLELLDMLRHYRTLTTFLMNSDDGEKLRELLEDAKKRGAMEQKDICVHEAEIAYDEVMSKTIEKRRWQSETVYKAVVNCPLVTDKGEK